MTVLLVSTSPRCTWLWAPDRDVATEVRALLERAGHLWLPIHPKHPDHDRITDVEIGVAAYDACRALAQEGYTFNWHPDEFELDRGNWPNQLPGMPGHRSVR